MSAEAIVGGLPQTSTAVACARRARSSCALRSRASAGTASSIATDELFSENAERSAAAPAAP